METVLLVIHMLLALALIGLVLVQRSENDGMGLGGGGGAGSLLSGRATANLLTRSTAILAAAFMLTSLILAKLVTDEHHTSIVDTIAVQQEGDAPAPQVPNAMDGAENTGAPIDAADQVPAEGAAVPAVPAEPAAPVTPSVPQAE